MLLDVDVLPTHRRADQPWCLLFALDPEPTGSIGFNSFGHPDGQRSVYSDQPDPDTEPQSHARRDSQPKRRRVFQSRHTFAAGCGHWPPDQSDRRRWFGL